MATLTTQRRLPTRLGFGLLAGTAAVVLGAGAWLTTSAEAHGGPGRPPMERTYEVTLTNLSTGQPLSPPVLATHSRRLDVFERGHAASEGIRKIAEEGDGSVLAAALEGMAGVDDVVATGAPLHRVGGPGPSSMTVTIDATGRANQLSLATMLICTNDGFTGGNGLRLPQGERTLTYYGRAYDAGTEANDETWTSIVDPCGAIGPVAAAADGQNTRSATDGVIRNHPGIEGDADLTSAHAWSEPVIKIEVRRIR